MTTRIRPPYEELAETWHALKKEMDETDAEESYRSLWHDRVFCDILTMCDWTIEDWNSESEIRTRRLRIQRQKEEAMATELSPDDVEEDVQ